MKAIRFKVSFALTLFLLVMMTASASPRFQNTFTKTKYLSVYPNPIKTKGTLKITMDSTCDLKVEFFDLSGKKVKEIKKQNLIEGVHQIEFSSSSLKQGIYICKATTNNWVKATRIRISH